MFDFRVLERLQEKLFASRANSLKRRRAAAGIIPIAGQERQKELPLEAAGSFG
jgi:hypothetical protein